MNEIEKNSIQTTPKRLVNKKERLLIYVGIAISLSLLFYWNYEKFIVSEIPLEKLNNITGRAGFDYFRKGLDVSLYNGSNWNIKELTFTVEVKEKDGSVRWKRQYKANTDISPQSDKVVSIRMVDIDDVGSHSWSIYSARGIKKSGVHATTNNNKQIKKAKGPVGFDYDRAVKDLQDQGSSLEEANLIIAKALSERCKFDLDSALRDGCTLPEIINFLTTDKIYKK